MDKEAKQIREIQVILERYCHRDFEDYITSFNPYPTAKELYERGYRKIGGEPPLVGDTDIARYASKHPFIGYLMVREMAQRDLDIKWYKEG